jgi:hypothetical protein
MRESWSKRKTKKGIKEGKAKKERKEKMLEKRLR